MKLIIIASEKAFPPVADSGTWLIRLVGMPQPEDNPPPGLIAIADDAAREIRETFPVWLWRWCRSESALNVQVWPGSVSWWWYTPISEKSPLRSPFIRELYWLALIKRMIQRLPVESVEWHGDDALLAAVVRQAVDAHHVPAIIHLTPRNWRRRPVIAWVQRVRYSLNHGLRWALAKCLGYGDVLVDDRPDTAFFTIYPTLWEFKNDIGAARMYGSWPQFLVQQGRTCFYPAAYHGNARSLLFRRNLHLRRCRQNKILFMETQLTLMDWLRCHFTFGFLARYFFWRHSHRSKPVLYGELDVASLWWRELDANVLNPEVPFDLMLSQSLWRITSRWPSLKLLFHHYEYQPMERALIGGAKRAGPLKVVGLQTSTFTSNQMGYLFPVEEIQTNGTNGLRAPIADYLAAYGELPFRIFSERLTDQRVCWSGPIRYPALCAPKFDRQLFMRTHDLPADVIYLTVTTSIAREESLALLETVFRMLAKWPRVYLLIKFHYLQPLQQETESLANIYHATDRYRVFDQHLLSLLRAAPVMLCAGSSTAMEAIQMGCMPLVYRPIGEMPCSPMLDVPESVYFWNTSEELLVAMRSCLEKDAAYAQRRDHWPGAIAAQMSPSDGSANTRLYEFLHAQHVFT